MLRTSVVPVSTRLRRVGVGHVEGEKTAEARVADRLDRRVRLEALGEDRGGLRLAREPHLERREAAQDEPRDVGRGDRSRARAELAQAGCVLGPTAHDDPGERVVVAGEELRRRVHDEVAAVLQGPQVERRRRGRSRRRPERRRPSPRRSRASSGTGSTAPRARRGRRRRAASPAGRTRRGARPSARAPRRGRPCRSTRPRRARWSAPGWRSARTRLVIAAEPDAKRSASPPSSSPSARSASATVGLEKRV